MVIGKHAMERRPLGEGGGEEGDGASVCDAIATREVPVADDQKIRLLETG